MRRWGVRQKFVAVLLLPALAALLLGGLQLRSVLSAGLSDDHAEGMIAAAGEAASLVHGLQLERDLVQGFAGRAPRNLAQFGHDPADVDRAARVLRDRLTAISGSVGDDPAFRGRIRAALGGLDRLAVLRRDVTSPQTQPSAAFRDYTTIIESLITLTGAPSTQVRDGALANQLVALESLAQVKESASRQRAILYGALVAGRLDRTSATDLAVARAQQAGAAAAFLSHASAAQQERYQAGVDGSAGNQVHKLTTLAVERGTTAALDLNAGEWFALASQQIDRIRGVEAAQVEDLSWQAQALRRDARNAALTGAVIVLLVLAFALLAAFAVMRAMLRSLGTLQSSTRDIAYRQLPDRVRRLQESQDPDPDVTVQPLQIETMDEVGQIARAFDAVHAEAVRLAGEQALTRNNINAMFVNLSRRSQVLVERQLRLIDELETGEQDPDRLASLFNLDHLATRMRRHDENLLVLAGAPGGRRRSQPVPLVDVVRAASAEVEQYSRIQIEVQPGHELAAAAVNDTIHLIAELLENATTFSPPHTPVRVRALGLGGKGEVVVEIEDEGIGMPPEELEKANERLASSASVNIAVSRMMGLFVVARLARRQGIQVQLRSSLYGGVVALVRLPQAIVLQPDSASGPEARLRLIPEQAEPVSPAPVRHRRPPPGPLGQPAPPGPPGPSGPPADAFDRLVSDLTNDPADNPANDPADDLDGIPAAALDAGGAATSPIFDALQSEWFRPALSADATGGFPAQPAGAGIDSARPASWTSPGDEGWRAVAAMSTQPAGGMTSAGLPLRVPGRNLVPGSAAASAAPLVPSHRSPEDARALSSYQEGIGRARAAREARDHDRPQTPTRKTSEDPS